MTVHVSVRSISALLLLSLLGLPAGAEAGVAVAIPGTYSDYREVGGMRVPHSFIESNEMTGRAIYQVERVEVDVDLPPDTFTLQPSAASGQAQ
jgi:hypothetical protein